MATTARESQTTTAAVQQLAGELLARSHEFAVGMAEHLYATIPELAALQDEELRAELRGRRARVAARR